MMGAMAQDTGLAFTINRGMLVHGAASPADCQITYSHDRGYLYIIRVIRFGESVERTVRHLPTSPSTYTLVGTIDLGTIDHHMCRYSR